MNLILKKPRLTAEQFERLEDTKGLELVDGRLEEKAVGGESSFVNNMIGTSLGEFVKAQRLGWVFDSECSYQCFPDRPRTVRKPDVSFIRFGRLPGEVLPKGHIRIRPDLVVEVLSPKDLWYRVEKKLDEYLSVNIPVIWVVNPQSRTIRVYRPEGTVTRLRDISELTGDPVLPGFRVRIADLLPPTPPAEPPAPAA
jgi:Uma2 family endonuclease